MPSHKIVMPKEEKDIIHMVNEYGSIYYNQIQHFFPKLTPEQVQFYVQYLYTSGWINLIDGDVIVPFGSNEANHEVAESIWVVIDNIDNIPGYCSIFRAQHPSSIMYQDNTGVMHECARIKPETAHILDLLQERFYARRNYKQDEDESFFQYMFIIDSPEYLDIISSHNLTVPHKIAVINTSNHEKNEVEYYE